MRYYFTNLNTQSYLKRGELNANVGIVEEYCFVLVC